jgi:hypothetical protein
MSGEAMWVVALLVTAFLSAVLGGVLAVLCTSWINKPEVRVVERKVVVSAPAPAESALFTAADEAAFWSGSNR